MITTLRGGRVFDAAHEALVDADVQVENDQIVAVGRNLVVTDGREIDVSGMTVLPGLINMHEHLTIRRTWGSPARQAELDDAYLVMRGVRACIALLKQGVTTVRELAAKHHLNIYLKRAVAAGLFPGPRVFAAGAPISVTGGHAWSRATEADGPEGMRRAVRETIKLGADWIKLITSNDPVHEAREGQHTHPEFSREELAAAVETAHVWGKRVAAHAMGREMIGWAIDVGVDSIEHGIYLDGALAERMKEKRVPLIPTLSSYRECTSSRWEPDQDRIARYSLLLEPHRESTRIAIQAGVRVGVGTDRLGDIIDELQLLVECGMSRAQVLRAATLTNAEILGIQNHVGTIEAGRIADMVVVRGDPVSDLRAMRSVEFTFRRGIGARPSEIVLPTDDESREWTSLSLLDGPH